MAEQSGDEEAATLSGSLSSSSTRTPTSRPTRTDSTTSLSSGSATGQSASSSPTAIASQPIADVSVSQPPPPPPSQAVAIEGPQLATTKLTTIVVPTVVGALFLAVVVALLLRRRSRRRNSADLEADMRSTDRRHSAQPPIQPPMSALPRSDSTLRGDSVFAMKKHDEYSVDSHHAVPASPSIQSYDRRSPHEDSPPSSALFVDLPSPNHRVAWRPERLPDSPHRTDDGTSSHSRTPSLAERRSQRLMRALQDLEPPVPTTVHGVAM